MDDNEKNFLANKAVLDSFKKNPIYANYWQNWNRAQDWIKNCQTQYKSYLDPHQETGGGFEADVLIDNFSIRESDSSMEIQMQETQVHVDDEDNVDMTEYYNITLKHKKEMEERRKKQSQDDALTPQVDYIDATEIGIHGVNSAEVDRPKFRQQVREHLKQMEESYGPHAEKIVTMEASLNYKFDELISKHGPQLWPNIPFKL